MRRRICGPLREASHRGAACHPGRHLTGLPLRETEQPLLDPEFAGQIRLAMEAEECLPQVLAHVDQVEDDRELQTAGGPMVSGGSYRPVFPLPAGVFALSPAQRPAGYVPDRAWSTHAAFVAG